MKINLPTTLRSYQTSLNGTMPFGRICNVPSNFQRITSNSSQFFDQTTSLDLNLLKDQKTDSQTQIKYNRSSVGLRREPEGIEHVNVGDDKLSERGRSVSSCRTVEPLMNVGQYDHSQEYDPYQSAAR
jgi:hypothetical protein